MGRRGESGTKSAPIKAMGRGTAAALVIVVERTADEHSVIAEQ